MLAATASAGTEEFAASFVEEAPPFSEDGKSENACTAKQTSTAIAKRAVGRPSGKSGFQR